MQYHWLCETYEHQSIVSVLLVFTFRVLAAEETGCKQGPAAAGKEDARAGQNADANGSDTSSSDLGRLRGHKDSDRLPPAACQECHHEQGQRAGVSGPSD